MYIISVHDLLFIAFRVEYVVPPKKEALTISIPIEKVAVGNLTNLLEVKGSHIKKELGVESLHIFISEDTFIPLVFKHAKG